MLKKLFQKKYYLSVFILIFLVSLSIILAVQLVILPYIFPSLHAGDGLLKGGDWLLFHQVAVSSAEQIKLEGWNAWELRPQGYFPAGVASAIYALTLPKPWVLAPLNALVHALSTLFVIRIVLLIGGNKRSAFHSAIPFAFFPSAMLWYTQIHRDGYYFLGMFMFLYGILLIADANPQIIRSFWSVLYASVGIFMIWLVRPHALNLYLYLSPIILVLITGFYLLQLNKKHNKWKHLGRQILLCFLPIVIIYLFNTLGHGDKYQQEFTNGVNSEFDSAADYRKTWTKTGFLPIEVEKQLYSVAILRDDFINEYGISGTSIDYDVSFNSAYDLISYLPRATQIALFAPFPSDWFAIETRSFNQVLWYPLAVETSIVYFMLLFLLVGIYRWKHKTGLYAVIVFCLLMILPLVYATPNIGTLYRLRYGFLMLLVALGVNAFVDVLSRIVKVSKDE